MNSLPGATREESSVFVSSGKAGKQQGSKEGVKGWTLAHCMLPCISAVSSNNPQTPWLPPWLLVTQPHPWSWCLCPFGGQHAQTWPSCSWTDNQTTQRRRVHWAYDLKRSTGLERGVRLDILPANYCTQRYFFCGTKVHILAWKRQIHREKSSQNQSSKYKEQAFSFVPTGWYHDTYSSCLLNTV